MIIFPAIDIIDSKPVRLLKGDFSTAKQVAGDALETAFGFEKIGCEWIHMVDLDGSLKKEPVNAETFISVAKNTNLKVELGGGIRTMNDIDYYINNGISRIILGSVALKNPELVKEAVKEFGSKIAVGIDAKSGFVATEGWVEKSDVYFTDLAKRMEDDRLGSPQTFRCRLETLYLGLRLFLRTEEQERIFPKERRANEFSC